MDNFDTTIVQVHTSARDIVASREQHDVTSANKKTEARSSAGSSHPADGLCPLNAFNRAAMGKYKMRIIWELGNGPKRYGELRRSAIVTAMGKAVTPRVLSRELKELQQRGLIHRKQYPVVPPKVEYTLSEM